MNVFMVLIHVLLTTSHISNLNPRLKLYNCTGLEFIVSLYICTSLKSTLLLMVELFHETKIKSYSVGLSLAFNIKIFICEREMRVICRLINVDIETLVIFIYC